MFCGKLWRELRIARGRQLPLGVAHKLLQLEKGSAETLLIWLT
jgi:hypothetical protein